MLLCPCVGKSRRVVDRARLQGSPYAGTKISSDPKPCQGLDKAVIKMTEYE